MFTISNLRCIQFFLYVIFFIYYVTVSFNVNDCLFQGLSSIEMFDEVHAQLMGEKESNNERI